MKMCYRFLAFPVLLAWLVWVLSTSDSDVDLRYRGCVKQCEETACVEQRGFSNGIFSSQWKNWVCQSDCRSHCKAKELLNDHPVRYRGKWPLRRTNNGKQEHFAVTISTFVLATHGHRWVSFYFSLYRRMPLRDGNRAYYPYASLWHTYGLLSLIFWFWNTVFYIRHFDLTEKLDQSSALALLTYSLIVAILRSCNVKSVAVRVMVAAPLIGFVATHIIYLNTIQLDYIWNMKVCTVMAVAKLTIWAVWAGVTKNTSRRKIWLVVAGRGLSMLLDINNLTSFPYVDALALWHIFTVPLTCIWWSFIQEDAQSEAMLNDVKKSNRRRRRGT